MAEAQKACPKRMAKQNQKKHKPRDDQVFFDLEEDPESNARDPSSDEDNLPASSVRVPRQK